MGGQGGSVPSEADEMNQSIPKTITRISLDLAIKSSTQVTCVSSSHMKVCGAEMARRK